MKEIKFNYRDLDVFNALRDLSEQSEYVSPTKIGLHLGYNYNGASSKCTRSLKKFVKEGIALRNCNGHYKISNIQFNVKLPEERKDIVKYLIQEYSDRDLFSFYSHLGTKYEDKMLRDFIAEETVKILNKKGVLR